MRQGTQETGSLTLGVHIFTARWQPFTRYQEIGGRTVTHPPRQVFRCHQCQSRRTAKHLKIQVCFDLVRIECADGCYGQRGRRWEDAG